MAKEFIIMGADKVPQGTYSATYVGVCKCGLRVYLLNEWSYSDAD